MPSATSRAGTWRRSRGCSMPPSARAHPSSSASTASSSADRIVGPGQNHAGARTTAVIPADHYSEIVVGHVGNDRNNVGPIVRVQASGPTIDSHYLWWASLTTGVNGLFRIDANGTTFIDTRIVGTSPVVDGDRLRLIARGQVIYGIKNGVRDFIYNTGPDTTKYPTGTTGILAFPTGPALTDAMIASWSSGAAPVSSGTWTSSTFAGTENPLDEGDRWYPLPTYAGFRKAGGIRGGGRSCHRPGWGSQRLGRLEHHAPCEAVFRGHAGFSAQWRRRADRPNRPQQPRADGMAAVPLGRQAGIFRDLQDEPGWEFHRRSIFYRHHRHRR